MAEKQTSWIDDLLMAASRRSNDIVGGVADLADRYGVSPANSAAWIAQHLAGYSPADAERIRRNLGGVGNFRNVVEAGVHSNEDRFRRAGGIGARTPEAVQMPTHLGAMAYKPLAAPRALANAVPAAVKAVPAALGAMSAYTTSHTPSEVGSDVASLLSKAYESVKADPYGAAFNTALYPAFPIATSAGDYAAMRDASQTLEPYAATDADAAKAQNMVDMASAIPLAVAAPVAGSFLRKKLAVKRGAGL